MEQSPTTLPVDDDPLPAAKVIARSAALGALIVFVLITAISMAAGEPLLISVAIAAMPAIFAGPLIAGMFAIGEYHRFEEAHGRHA